MTSNYRAETVIQNANVITMDPRRPRAQAVAMGHGRFLAVGDNDDVAGLIGPDTKVMDLGHSTVLPGFIDAHIHVLNISSTSQSVSVTPADIAGVTLSD